MKKIIALASALLVAMTLSACGNPEVSGTVTDKEFEPWHQTTRQVPVYSQHCTTTGSPPRSNCSQRLSHYRTDMITHPDRWKLEVADEKSGKERWVTVGEIEYSKVDIGDFFTNIRPKGQ